MKMKKPKISVIGLGFIGLTLSVVNANNGFQTIGIDIDKEKIRKLSNGEATFFEPDLKKILRESIKKRKIVFTDELSQILSTDITFVTVGTPSNKKGELDLNNLRKVISDLSKILQKKKSYHLVVIKSTVIPGTTKNFILNSFKNHKKIGLVTNPEFLREGSAVNDLLKPFLIVIGGNKTKDCNVLEQYYKLFYKNIPMILTTNFATAEMIKYSFNAIHATKISFVNTLANICQKISSVDVMKVVKALEMDSKYGSSYLNPGPGFGGSCLPKDLSALINFTKKIGKRNEFLKAVERVNKLQPIKVFQILENMNLTKKSNNIAILGLAFKKDTDDIREAVSIKVVKELLKKRVKVQVHDPMALNNFKKIFGNKLKYCERIDECLKNADCCVILTDWDEYTKMKPSFLSKNMKKTNIIDARRILDPAKFSKFNFKAIGFGN